MPLEYIPTEMLIKLRERFGSGHAHFHAMAASIEWTQEFERQLFAAVDGELRRRPNQGNRLAQPAYAAQRLPSDADGGAPCGGGTKAPPEETPAPRSLDLPQRLGTRGSTR
jgi:hypothetical protein